MIIGVDTASDRWHASIRYSDGANEVFKAHYPTKGESRHWSADERRQRIVEDFRTFLRQEVAMVTSFGEEIHLFCEESQAFGKNGKTTRLLNMATGALWTVGLEFDMFWHWVGSSQWKALVGTSGKKTAVAVPLERDWAIEHGAHASWEDHDHYVAFILAEYGERALVEAMLR